MVYAWSVFSTALKKPDAMALTNHEASLPFTITIGMIFIGTYPGGRIQDKVGPRPVALVGGVVSLAAVQAAVVSWVCRGLRVQWAAL